MRGVLAALALSLSGGATISAQETSAKPSGDPSASAAKKEDKPGATQEQKAAADQPSRPLPQEQKPPEKKPPEKKPEESSQQPEKLQLETPEAAPRPEALPPAPGTTAQPPGKAPIEEEQKAVIDEIIFRGNRRVPAATLRARVFSHHGDPYDENAL